MPMKWESSRSDSQLVGHPKGRIDEDGWRDFQTFLNGEIEEAAKADLPLTIDLTGVDYMSSRGLRVLTQAKREADGKGVTITLARPNAMIREILEISYYDKIFAVRDTLD